MTKYYYIPGFKFLFKTIEEAEASVYNLQRNMTSKLEIIEVELIEASVFLGSTKGKIERH